MIDRMKKFKKIFEVASCEALTPDSVLLKATPVDGEMPEILGGQFVNILVPQVPFCVALFQYVMSNMASYGCL